MSATSSAGPGDLVINTLWAWMAALGVTRHTGIVSPAYGVYRPIDGGRHPACLCGSLAANVRCTRPNTNADRRASTARGLRLYPEQFLTNSLSWCRRSTTRWHIVRFLDWANGRLDRTIRAKRRVIALLTEQKQVIIQRAVTTGFDPGAGTQGDRHPLAGRHPVALGSATATDVGTPN
jgi:type I restriction enzyme S subunit